MVQHSGYLITCSEDTRIISRFNKNDKTETTVIDHHTTSLRRLYFNGVLLISGGGKEILAFHKINRNGQFYYLASYTPRFVTKINFTNSSIYLYSDYDNDGCKMSNREKRKIENHSANCRIMDIVMVKDIVFILYSDGSSHILRIKLDVPGRNDEHIEFIVKFVVSSNHCPLKVKYNCLSDSNPQVVTVDSGGNLKYWQFTETEIRENTIQEIGSIRVDNAGLNAVVSLGDFVFTGGDRSS